MSQENFHERSFPFFSIMYAPLFPFDRPGPHALYTRFSEVKNFYSTSMYFTLTCKKVVSKSRVQSISRTIDGY